MYRLKSIAEIHVMLLKHWKFLFKQQYQTGHICKRESILSWNIDAWYPMSKNPSSTKNLALRSKLFCVKEFRSKSIQCKSRSKPPCRAYYGWLDHHQRERHSHVKWAQDLYRGRKILQQRAEKKPHKRHRECPLTKVKRGSSQSRVEESLSLSLSLDAHLRGSCFIFFLIYNLIIVVVINRHLLWMCLYIKRSLQNYFLKPSLKKI